MTLESYITIVKCFQDRPQPMAWSKFQSDVPKFVIFEFGIFSCISDLFKQQYKCLHQNWSEKLPNYSVTR